LHFLKDHLDRIVSNFASKAFLIDEIEISGITLSIGITEYLKNEGRDRFVHRADVTMYQAKQNDGNSIMMSPDVKTARFTMVQ
jgi:GGDEF domain-containing protein